MNIKDVWKQVSVETKTFDSCLNPYVNLWVTYELPNGHRMRASLYFPDNETADHIAKEINESLKNKANVKTSPEFFDQSKINVDEKITVIAGGRGIHRGLIK